MTLCIFIASVLFAIPGLVFALDNGSTDIPDPSPNDSQISKETVQAAVDYNPNQKAPSVTNGGSSDKGGTNGIKDDGSSFISKYIGMPLMKTGATILGFSGSLFDLTLRKTIFEFGDQMNGSFGNIINTGWTIIRDVCNILFIFGLLFAGVQLIIKQNTNQVKTLVTHLIVGALIINFSLFATKAVIDATNLATVSIYNTLVVGSEGKVVGDSENTGVRIASATGVTGFYTDSNSISPNKLKELGEQGFTFFFIGFIFFIIASVFFVITSVMLLFRFAFLVIIMIFSPILAISYVIPEIGKKLPKGIQDMVANLFSNALFPPIFLFLILIAVKVLEVSTAGYPNLGPSSWEHGASAAVFKFGLALTLLFTAYNIAKKANSYVSGQASSLTKRALGAATFGAAAAIGRKTIGGAAYKTAQNKAAMENLREQAARGGIRGAWGAAKLKSIESASKATFDARRSDAWKKLQGTSLGKQVGLKEFGEGKEGGYVAGIEAEKKRIDERAKVVGKVGDDDARVALRKEEVSRAKLEEEKIKRDIELAEKRHSAAVQQLKKLPPTASRDDILKAQNVVNDSKALLDTRRGSARELKKTTEEAENRLEQERNRRMVGSSFTPENSLESYQKALKALSDTSKKAEEYTKKGTLSAEEQKALDYIKKDEEKQRAFIEKLAKTMDKEAVVKVKETHSDTSYGQDRQRLLSEFKNLRTQRTIPGANTGEIDAKIAEVRKQILEKRNIKKTFDSTERLLSLGGKVEHDAGYLAAREKELTGGRFRERVREAIKQKRGEMKKVKR